MLSCCCFGLFPLRRRRRSRQRTNPSPEADEVGSKLSAPTAGGAAGRFIRAPSAAGAYEEGGPRGGMAPVKVLSSNPFGDFRRSMLEAVEARRGAAAGEEEVVFDWGFMDELLTCYLSINDRSVHDDILRAYADLTTSFRFIAR